MAKEKIENNKILNHPHHSETAEHKRQRKDLKSSQREKD